jgi:multidrug resistance efflux pump
MRATSAIIVVLAALTGVGGHLALNGRSDSAAFTPARPPVYLPDHVAANGVVEGAHPEVALRPEIAGTIVAIYFRENQDVTKGDVLVELSNDTQKQQVALAQAAVAEAKADLDKLRNGARAEERDAKKAVENAKLALYEQAKKTSERSISSSKGHGLSVSQQEIENDKFQMQKAQAEYEFAVAERKLIEAPPRPDELAAAEAKVAAADARLRLAEAELAKTRLVARANGRILQVFAEPGELAGPASAQPILLMADLSKRRVRAFIEELDAARVKAGQRGVVTADGLADQEYPGTVAVVMPRMGKRALQTDAPQEYKDLYFREVLIDLDRGDDLTLNLRVKTRIKVQ